MVTLSVEQLCASYRLKSQTITANRNITLRVSAGEFVWIRGNSGAGKSTFLNTISGIYSADSGRVLWGDTEITQLSKKQSAEFRLHYCGLVFQFFELLKTQNVLHNAALPMKIARKTSTEITARMAELLDAFSVKHLMKKRPQELSGGERQRIAIIRALANAPLYIIADEITASLDIKLSHAVYEYLHDYVKRADRIGIFVSHDPTIARYADSCYTMHEGTIEQCTL